MHDTFDLIATYNRAFADYQERGIDETLNPDDQEVAGIESWHRSHYFQAGASALSLIITALISTGRPLPRRILDFPSGSGRVTRHLRAFFPEAELWACDIRDNHLAFCEAQFGVKVKHSFADLRTLHFDAGFDLVFCGSLFTHLPQAGVSAGLQAITRALGPSGVAIVTFHGRHSGHIQRHKWKYLDDERFKMAEAQAERTGFGFVNYEGAMRQRFNEQAHYGIALVRPSWVMQQLESVPDIRIYGFTERGWDDHQDVLVFGRPGVNE